MRVPRFGSLPDHDVPWLSPPSSKSRRAAVLAARERIVLVADDTMLGFALQGVLENRYAVELARDPVRALQILATSPCDVILADDRLPGGRDGIQLLEEVRRRHPGVRRLLMTGDASLLPWRECPWDHVLQKPFALEDLLEHLQPAASEAELADVPGPA